MQGRKHRSRSGTVAGHTNCDLPAKTKPLKSTFSLSIVFPPMTPYRYGRALDEPKFKRFGTNF